MATHKDIYELVNELNEAVSLTFNIDSVTDNGDGTYTLTTCDTLHLQSAIDGVGYTVDIGGNAYTVTDVTPNQNITVSGSVLPVVTSFTVYPLFFYHGTILATRSELHREPSYMDKYPMLYMLERIRERFIEDDESTIEREVDLQLFFLALSDPEQWDTDDHYTRVIKPMKNAALRFVDACKEATNVESISDYTIIPHAKFGEYLDKGTVKKIFDESSGGVELQIQIRFMKPACSSC